MRFAWVFILCLIPSILLAQQFRVQGNANQTGPLTYDITLDGASQAGMITNYYPVNLAQNFKISFELNFGTKDDNGADGMAFVLSNTCAPLLNVGQGLGVSNIPNSLIVEFDTFFNMADSLNDQANDHAAIYADGQLKRTGNVLDGLPVPVCLLPNCSNVETGLWYPVTIEWTYVSATEQRLQMYFNGVLRVTSTRNHIAERFNNSPVVFWSLAGSTGFYSNRQQFQVGAGNNNIIACEGTPFTLTAPGLGSNYSWSGGSASTTDTARFTANANTTITCNYRDFCGEARTVSFQVEVRTNPQVTVSNNGTCASIPAQITAEPQPAGTYAFTWSGPPGFINPGNVSSFTTAREGIYSVVIRDTIGNCTSSVATTTVVLAPAPRPSFTPLPAQCRGTIPPVLPAISLNGIAGSWSPTLQTNTTATYYFTPATGVCAYTDSMTLTILQPPVIVQAADTFQCAGAQVLLQPVVRGDFVQFRWQDGRTDSFYRVERPGTYTLTATNTCGTAVSTIRVTERFCDVYIPSAFTPNEDGRNDVFRISGADLVTDFSMEVYNRWGQQIFSTSDARSGWNGQLNGIEQPHGIYAYRIRYRLLQSGQQILQKGTFVLIR